VLTVIRPSLFALLLIGGCDAGAPERLVSRRAGALSFGPASNAPAVPIACFDRAVCLVKFKASTEAVNAGSTVQLSYTWWVRRELGKDWKVFVHGARDRHQTHRFSDDHRVLDGHYPSRRWRVGDLISETRTVRIPPATLDGSYELWGGLYKGAERLAPSSGARDGSGRALFGRLTVRGRKVPKPSATVPHSPGPILLDGKLDEPAWALATRIGPFGRYDGNGTGRWKTTAKLLWQDDALYVGFECPDDHVHSPYTEDDQPIYESEAVELFIDADRDADEYVELQAAPTGIRFDASFKGGARQGMTTAWNHPFTVGTSVDGTLNEASDTDRGWVSEWRIPFAGLIDQVGPVGPGTRWAVNFFRLDRGRKGGTDATAWSPPLSGDFHRLERFGTLVFGARLGGQQRLVAPVEQKRP
jgi:hypothetical protein